LGIYYTPFAVGPVADAEYAEASLLPSSSADTTRSLHVMILLIEKVNVSS